MALPIGERLIAIETNMGHMKNDTAEIKDTMGKLFDVSNSIRDAQIAADAKNESQDDAIAAQDKALDEHKDDEVAHHPTPCNAVNSLGARGWALLIVVIGALIAAVVTILTTGGAG